MSLGAYGEARGFEIDPEAKRADAVESFVRGLFRDAGIEAPPEHRRGQLTPEATDALLDLLIAKGRESR